MTTTFILWKWQWVSIHYCDCSFCSVFAIFYM